MSYKVPKAHFTKITNKVIRNDEMSDTTYRVYSYIASTNQGRFKLSASSIARNLKKGRSTVNRSIKELEDLGYLTRILTGSNTYDFHLFSTPKG